MFRIMPSFGLYEEDGEDNKKLIYGVDRMMMVDKRTHFIKHYDEEAVDMFIRIRWGITQEEMDKLVGKSFLDGLHDAMVNNDDITPAEKDDIETTIAMIKEICKQPCFCTDHVINKFKSVM